MPSPRARNHPIDERSASLDRPNVSMRVESTLLMAFCIFLGFVLPLLLRSRFDGVWFRTGGDQSEPGEMQVLARHGKFSEIIPIGCLVGSSYETITLIADGREHQWSEPPGCTIAIEPGITSYSAQLTKTSFKLIKRRGSATFTESWDIVDHGRMIVSDNGRTATYKRASWLRSLFTEEP
jgi:hypothetical protein